MPWNRAGPGGIRCTVSRDEVSMAAHPVAISTLPSRKPASLSDKAHTTAPTPAAPSDASRKSTTVSAPIVISQAGGTGGWVGLMAAVRGWRCQPVVSARNVSPLPH
ncbi:hypothetical protein G6F59_015348 [Rhizopus arrhizus]|nr:hypothetical protein G6F59_015348 [Rhizopus arrhizus]